jgi:hypothetical protein
MQKDYKLNITEMISISPSKVCKTLNITKSVKNSLGYWELKEKPKTNTTSNKLEKKFHNFEISANSQKNLRSKVEWLFQYARSRNVKTYTNKFIKNYKCGFITLTLPSKQKHNTAYIITQMLDEFLQQLRKRIKMINYVWRLEFQANGNAHFHIVTDSYADYYLVQKLWNKILDKHGYIEPYRNKMSKLTYNEYINKFGTKKNGEKIQNEILFKRYNYGKSTNWSNPNTVDCKNISKGGSISFYISKYFSKKEKSAKKNDLDNESNSFALRLCYWSRSLSRCKSESMPIVYYDANIFELLKKDESVHICNYDYCTVIYYEFSKLSGFVKELIHRYFIKSRDEIEYVPA